MNAYTSLNFTLQDARRQQKKFRRLAYKAYKRWNSCGPQYWAYERNAYTLYTEAWVAFKNIADRIEEVLEDVEG